MTQTEHVEADGSISARPLEKTALWEGRRVGRYIVGGRVSEGGMSSVYRAVDPLLRREVVIKAARPDSDDSRLAREGQIHRALIHPHILQVLDVISDRGEDFVVSELVSGGDLAARLREHSGGLPVDEATSLLLQMAQGLAFAHTRGVVHRDLKAENILLEEGEAGAPIAKINDFGISKRSGDVVDLETDTDEWAPSIAGTFTSMSPEQTHGRKVEPPSDIFSLGTLAYRMFTGEEPFDQSTRFRTLEEIRSARQMPVLERRPDAPPEISVLIDAMLEKQPRHRPTAKAVVRTLEGQLDHPREGVLGWVWALECLTADGLESHKAFQEAVRRIAWNGGAQLVEGSAREAVCAGIIYGSDPADCEGLAQQLWKALLQSMGEANVRAGWATGLLVGSRKGGRHLIVVGDAFDEAAQACRDTPPGCISTPRQRLRPAPVLLERASVLGAVHEVLQDSGRVEARACVAVSGPPGVGRTACLQAMLPEFWARGIPTIALGGLELDVRPPYALLRRLVKHLLGMGFESEAATRIRVEKLGGEGLLPLLATEMADSDASLVLKRDDYERALAVALAKVTPHRRMALVIDGLEHADAESVRVLGYALEAEWPPRSIVMLGLEDPSRFPYPSRGRINWGLRPLSQEASEQLLGRLTEGVELSEEDGQAIVERAGGRPGDIETWVRAATGRLVPAPLSADLETAVEAQIAELPTACRRMLDVVAAAGPFASHAFLASAFGISELKAEDETETLVSRGLLKRVEVGQQTSVGFYHRWVRELVRRKATRRQLELAHLRVCIGLESGARPRRSEVPARFAHHYQWAGLAENAIPFWTAAGEQAARMGAGELARQLYERALSLVNLYEDRLRRDTESYEILRLQSPHEATEDGQARVNAQLKALRSHRKTPTSSVQAFWDWTYAWLSATPARIQEAQARLLSRPSEQPIMRYFARLTEGVAQFDRGRWSDAAALLRAALNDRASVFSKFEGRERLFLTLPSACLVYMYAVSGYPREADELLVREQALVDAGSLAHSVLTLVGSSACLVSGAFERASLLAQAVEEGSSTPLSRQWARLYRQAADLRRELALASPNERTVRQKLDELDGAATTLDAGPHRGARLMPSYVHLSTLVRVPARLVRARRVARSQMGLRLKAVERFLNDEGLVKAHLYMLHHLHEARAKAFEIQRDFVRSAAAREAALNASGQLQRAHPGLDERRR